MDYGLYEKHNILTYYMRCKRLEWLGHVWRADEDVLKNIRIEKLIKNVYLEDQEQDGNATLDWTLDREKWR